MLIRLLLLPAWKIALIGLTGGGDAGGELAIAPEPPDWLDAMAPAINRVC